MVMRGIEVGISLFVQVDPNLVLSVDSRPLVESNSHDKVLIFVLCKWSAVQGDYINIEFNNIILYTAA